ncbi:hypothetical protein TI39_contig51g00003 [Zymoseptoria brevis]|uniref:Wax synthase domain-containing protein n=1 Tax=Zymoseptoria brevis TaxID=1047168 RepID=A0A0F4H1R0_9PEZI|nr:hypothetical protein TI39_contig51g00003 [Zymoseptoria brevis]
MHLSAVDLALILLAQALLTVLPVGFTKPGSWIRGASVAVSTILMLLSVFAHKDSFDCLTRMVLVFSPPALVLQNLNISLLRRWDFDYAGPRPREPGKKEPSRPLPDSAWNRLTFGFSAATEYRHCGTLWEVENVPAFRKSDPKFVPSRREFLVRRGLLLLSIYLFMDLLGVLASQDVNKAPTEPLPIFGRLEDFTMREVLDRLVFVVLFLVFGAASTTLHFGYGGYLLVLLGLSEPKRWRPVVNFEHVMPYSIRRLWR